MYLRYINITNTEGTVRTVRFQPGLNLIVDEACADDTGTGNNVGKTTLLNLIAYCLGGEAKDVYRSADGQENREVSQFLTQTQVVVELGMVATIAVDESRRVVVCRNFLKPPKNLCTVNGKQVSVNDLPQELERALWNIEVDRPSFSDIISRSLRIDSERLSHTLRTIGSRRSLATYEALYLWWFGVSLPNTGEKTELLAKKRKAEGHQKWLLNGLNLAWYRAELANVKDRIADLQRQRTLDCVNPHFEEDLEKMNQVRDQLRTLGDQLSLAAVRRRVVKEAREAMLAQQSSIDHEQVREIYRQANVLEASVAHTCDELLRFHNQMMKQRADYVSQELPALDQKIVDIKRQIDHLRRQERGLQERVALPPIDLDHIVEQLTDAYADKGRLENVVGQLKRIEGEINDANRALSNIDGRLHSPEWQEKVRQQVDKFNDYYRSTSEQIYHQTYCLDCQLTTNRGEQYYKFQSCAPNSYSGGKKIGEILCFDLAYVRFADAEHIPCLHFALYDKFEMVHDNQQDALVGALQERDALQCVAAVLHDKSSSQMARGTHVVLKLSEQDRLFRMEQSRWYRKRYGLDDDGGK